MNLNSKPFSYYLISVGALESLVRLVVPPEFTHSHARSRYDSPL